MQLRLATAITLLALVPTARGDLVVRYNLSGEPGNQASTSATTFDTNVSVSVLTRGSGVSPLARAGSINSGGWTAANAAAAIGAGDYYTFTVTPNAGFSMSLTDFFFADIRSDMGNPVTNFAVRSSLDNYTLDLLTGTPAITATNRSINLPVSFQNLTQAVTFRLIAWGASNANREWGLVNHSTESGVVVNGTVTAVPEPGAFLFGGLVCGVIGLAAGVRRLFLRRPLPDRG